MVCEQIIRVLEKQSPRECACGWDNVGLLVGDQNKEVRRIYVALDATDETIDEAKEAGADLLLTHHPLIFKGIKKINREDFIGRRIIELIKNDMAYYAMHTNFDILGMADLAAEKLGLTETSVLQVTQTLCTQRSCAKDAEAECVGAKNAKAERVGMKDAGSVGARGAEAERKCANAAQDTAGSKTAVAIGLGKVGNLPHPMSLADCIRHVKQAFAVDTVKVFAPSLQKEGLEEFAVRRAAVCPGSGKSVIEDALAAGAQVLITGDIDHHEGIDAAARKMAVIDAGHYGVEKMFIPYMKQYLEDELSGVEVLAQGVKQPFLYL